MNFIKLLRNTLTEKEAIAYYLTTEKSMTYREIGDLLGVSHAAVALWVEHAQEVVNKTIDRTA